MKAIRQFIIKHAAMTCCRVWMTYHRVVNQLGIGVKPVPTKELNTPVQEPKPNPNSARSEDRADRRGLQMRK